MCSEQMMASGLAIILRRGLGIISSRTDRRAPTIVKKYRCLLHRCLNRVPIDAIIKPQFYRQVLAPRTFCRAMPLFCLKSVMPTGIAAKLIAK